MGLEFAFNHAAARMDWMAFSLKHSCSCMRLRADSVTDGRGNEPWREPMAEIRSTTAKIRSDLDAFKVRVDEQFSEMQQQMAKVPLLLHCLFVDVPCTPTLNCPGEVVCMHEWQTSFSVPGTFS